MLQLLLQPLLQLFCRLQHSEPLISNIKTISYKKTNREKNLLIFLVGQQKIDRNSLLIKDLRFYFLTKNPKGSNLGSFVATNVARFLPKIGFD
jgi:hypothetical protein